VVLTGVGTAQMTKEGQGYVKSVITVEEILGSYDDHLFHTASCENRCLHHLLPVAKSSNYALRVGPRCSVNCINCAI